MRNAERRHRARCPARPGTAWSAPGTTVSAAVQRAAVLDGLRTPLRQRRRDDARGRWGNTRRNEPGHDPGHHRPAACRTLSVRPGPAGAHPQGEPDPTTLRVALL